MATFYIQLTHKLGSKPIERVAAQLSYSLSKSFNFSEEAYLEFLKTNFPDYNKRMVTVPVSFQFNIPVKDEITKETKVIQGILSKEEGRGGREKSKEEKDWYKAASGLSAEQKIFDKLQEQFSDQPCLMVNGFHENYMIKVIKEKIQQDKKRIELSDQVTISF